MRILHLLGVGRLSANPGEQALSGLTRAVLTLARTQAANGHEVFVVTFDSTQWTTDWNNVQLVGLTQVPWAYLKIGPFSLDYRRHLAVVRFVAQGEFDVVQGHNYSYLRLLKSTCRIVTFHGDPLYYGWTSRDFATARRFSTQFVAVSDFISSVVAGELKLPKESIPVIHNGVDSRAFDTTKPEVLNAAKIRRQQLGIKPDQPVFLYAGAISVEKGARELALAFRQVWSEVPCAALVIAGTSHIWGGTSDKRTLTSFEEEIQEILMACRRNVHFLDNVPGEEMPCVYAMADVVVVPSTVKEGFGLSALESMACGRPVIASRVGGLPEIVDGRCGLLIEPGDVEMLSDAMIKLAHQPELRSLMGASGVKKARIFSWERAAQLLDTVYQA